MRILLIRHAEPDYTVDSLNPKGRVEAELLSRRLANILPSRLILLQSPQIDTRSHSKFLLRHAQSFPIQLQP